MQTFLPNSKQTIPFNSSSRSRLKEQVSSKRVGDKKQPLLPRDEISAGPTTGNEQRTASPYPIQPIRPWGRGR